MAKTKATNSREDYSTTIMQLSHNGNISPYERIEYCYQILLNFKEEYDTLEIGRDRTWLLTWAKYVRESCMLGIANGVPGNWESLYWQVTLLEARHRVIDSYLMFLERKREQHAKFYEPRREIFIKHGIIQAIQDLVDDKLDLLSISLPPGTGKTTLEIFVLSGIIGWFPDMPNLA